MNGDNSAGCKVRSHPDSSAKSLEIYQVRSLNLTGLDLSKYEDKDYVQTTFLSTSTRHLLESIQRVVNSRQLTLRPGNSDFLSLLFLNS